MRPVVALVLGFCWANWVASAVLNTVLPSELEKKDVVIFGQVIGVPKITQHSQRFEFKVEHLAWQGITYRSPGKIRLRIYRTQPRIRSGQYWQFTARLKQSRSFQNPGSRFNYETYLFQHRLRATGYVRAQPIPLQVKTRQAYSVDAFRQRVANFIRTSLASSPRSGVITALVVGLRSDIQPSEWEVLQSTATIHLIAISGLHIGLVFGLVWLLGTWGWRFAGRLPLIIPAPRFGVIAGLLAGAGYALLAGMTIPTQRAVCMLTVVAIALFFQRKVFSSETLVIALTVVLAVNPLAPLADGLWLSFGAVLVLILGVVRTQSQHSSVANITTTLPNHQRTGWRLKIGVVGQRLKNWMAQCLWCVPVWRLGRPLKGIAVGSWRMIRPWVVVQIVLFIGMTPLLLTLFQQVSLVAPLANLIAVPVLGIIAVPLSLLGLMLYMLELEFAAELAFKCALWVVNMVWGLLEWLAAVAWAVWQQPSPPLWSLPLAAIGILLLLSRSAFPARCSGLLWLLPLFFPPPDTLNPRQAGEFHYSMLEVGHGLASVVQTRNHLLVYDTGPSFANGMDAGKMVVVPFLQQLGISGMDVLVISHSDNDHSGGHLAVLERFKAARILTSNPAKIPLSQPCQAGQNWHWDEVKFEMLSPAKHTYLGNDASCVLKVSSQFGSLLLTGDIGKSAETSLVNSGADIAVDILQVPHHGSKTSSTEIFLRHTQPRLALASVGYLNRYGHPHKVVRERYARYRIPMYHTAEEGAVTVSFFADGIVVQGSRAANHKFWLQPPQQLSKSIRLPARPQNKLSSGKRSLD